MCRRESVQEQSGHGKQAQGCARMQQAKACSAPGAKTSHAQHLGWLRAADRHTLRLLARLLGAHPDVPDLLRLVSLLVRLVSPATHGLQHLRGASHGGPAARVTPPCCPLSWHARYRTRHATLQLEASWAAARRRWVYRLHLLHIALAPRPPSSAHPPPEGRQVERRVPGAQHGIQLQRGAVVTQRAEVATDLLPVLAGKPGQGAQA